MFESRCPDQGQLLSLGSLDNHRPLEPNAMVARIYKPAKTAMQSGVAQAKEWVLEHEPTKPRSLDPLMGWTSSAETVTQVTLRFASKEEAVAYAEREGLAYTVVEPAVRRSQKKSYAENFKFGRIGQWTH
ncbi:MAG: ETC complex I subunit [Hyphomicrobiaceae bacterium]